MIFLIAFFALLYFSTSPVFADSQIWPIQSIDTMKTSRDLARQKLNDPTYLPQIQQQLQLIKNSGANYVAIDTPYDDQFYPYLKSWVDTARRIGLHVWFRGNWSSWEGWFNYPKNLTPQNHQTNTVDFIRSHPELFADGDIFDACPECENAKNFHLPQDHQAFLKFLADESQAENQAFLSIHKQVKTNIRSMTGGLAKDILDQSTASQLGNIVTLDHYHRDPQNYYEYINYFAKHLHSTVVFGEFGSPIPGINTSQTPEAQAGFINQVLLNIYGGGQSVMGLNYNVLNDGTSRLVDSELHPLPVYQTLKNYYSPANLNVFVKDQTNSPVSNLPISLNQRRTVYSDNIGQINVTVPAIEQQISILSPDFAAPPQTINPTNLQNINLTFTVTPTRFNLIYELKIFIHKLLNEFNSSILKM